MIEQVLIKKTLKAGETIWEEGKILTSPLPEILLEEIKLETGTVEVLKGDKNDSSDKLVFVAKKVEGIDEKTTTTSQFKTETGHEAVNKPEAQLKEPQRSRKPDLEPYMNKPRPVLKRRKR